MSAKYRGLQIQNFSELRIHLLWARLGSNQRPSGYEPPALTAELRARTSK